jgi:hypothetical protein
MVSLVLVQFGIGTRVRTLQNVGRRVARLYQLRGLCRTITSEPSAVAPDAKVYVGYKLGNTLNTQFDFSIRRAVAPDAKVYVGYELGNTLNLLAGANGRRRDLAELNKTFERVERDLRTPFSKPP